MADEQEEEVFAHLAEEEVSDSPIEFEPLIPSNEPELITEEEAAQTDIPLPAEPEEQHIACTVCDICLELNLTTKSVIRCSRCEQAFCMHFASTIDVQYCVNCLSDISMAKSIITKTYEHTNAETGEKSFYRRKARDIQISGLDWLFAQRKISELSDIELDLAIEYHRNILSLMISEQERKRTEKMHRYANVRVHVPTISTTSVNSATTTTVKKIRTVSKTKAQEQLAAVLGAMKAKGMKIEDIMRMIKK